jgi:peptidoglycan-associated lipoprotein
MSARHGVQSLRWWAAAAACTLLTACHHQPPPAAPAPAPPPAPAVVGAAPPPAPGPRTSQPQPRASAPAALSEEELFARASIADLNAKSPLDDTFFAYDQYQLSDTARTALDRDAAWMRKWHATRVLVEGHADERGTNEYNLALAERRAEVTRDYLVNVGIDKSRISIVSKGKEQPFCRGEGEDCWHQNRRGHFIITAK